MRALRAVVVGVVVVTLMLGVPGPASADLVSSSEALALEEDGRARAMVDAYLARQEVAAELAELGVDPELARLRAAAMSAAELEELAGRIEQAPAGGTSVITVLGVTFVVLLVLELVGVIDIFKRF
jgi:hypothetical protein